MTDLALFDFTPNFCPDCGAAWSLFENKYTWLDYRSGIPHNCPGCGLSFHFERNLQTINRRIQDEQEEKQSR